jgi:hypothetical protein
MFTCTLQTISEWFGGPPYTHIGESPDASEMKPRHHAYAVEDSKPTWKFSSVWGWKSGVSIKPQEGAFGEGVMEQTTPDYTKQRQQLPKGIWDVVGP